MFYVFDGDDTFSCHEAVAALKARMGDPGMAELNTAHLDGRTTDLNEIRHHCDTIPFLADRRLVIVRGLLGRLAQKGQDPAETRFLNDLVDYLPNLPQPARLVFVESTRMPKNHPVLALARKGGTAHLRTFISPTGTRLVRWTRQRVQQAGGAIEPGAAKALCAFVGNDLHQLNQEIQKLVAYTDGQRPITEQDIHLLTPHARHASIFELVDALGRRDSTTASRICRQLLDAGDHPLALLAMITRQFRLMILVKELAPKLGTPQAIARQLRQNPYPIKKILAQSKNHSTEQLRLIYHALADTDLGIKTGRIDATLALDILIASLSRGA